MGIGRAKKVRSGINAKPTSGVIEQLRYPPFSLGQTSGYIGMNLQFHNLTYKQFVAGELEMIVSCVGQNERDGRLELLHLIAQWQLRVNATWTQVRSTYAHILRKVENGEINWRTDWDKFEHNIYDRVLIVSHKSEKLKTSSKATVKSNEFAWFCRAYQKPEGCAKESPHPGRVGNQLRQSHHICATCWIKEKIKKNHPECSTDCPHMEA